MISIVRSLGAVISTSLMEAELKTDAKAMGRLKKIGDKRYGEITKYDIKHPSQHDIPGRHDPIFKDPKRQLLVAKMVKTSDTEKAVHMARSGELSSKALRKEAFSGGPSYAISDALRQMKNPKPGWTSKYGRENPEQGVNVDRTSPYHKWLGKKDK